MIYTVECSYADPASEAEWNTFYSADKLPALVSVKGFHTSQRFKAVSPDCPVYLALHTIDGLDVLTGDDYRRRGGGNFARWQPHITDWHRNLYDGVDRAPALGDGDRLVLSADGSDPLLQLGVTPGEMRAIALDKHPERRWIATLDRTRTWDSGRLPQGVHVYAPITAQLTHQDSGAAATAR